MLGAENVFLGHKAVEYAVDFEQTALLWDFSGNRKCFFHRKADRDSRMDVGKLHLELGVV